MNGILRLNDYNVEHNATLGAHDPSMMWDPVTRKYYSYGTDVYMPRCGLRDQDRDSSPQLGGIWYIFNMKELSCQNTLSVREEIMERIRRPLISGRPMWNMWRRSTECIIRRPDDLAVLSRESGSRRQSTRWGPFENRGVVADTWGTDDTLPKRD